MLSKLKETVESIAAYFDGQKVGCQGTKGFRKTTDLAKMSLCIEALLQRRLLDPETSVFMDLGAGDGRVNLLMSYFANKSIGIEIDGEILSEYYSRRKGLIKLVEGTGLVPPPDNISLFSGDSLEEGTHERIAAETGVSFGDVDLFYTYITLHDLFAQKIAEEAKTGAMYMVYGFSKIIPRYDGLKLLEPDLASQGMVILYRKV